MTCCRTFSIPHMRGDSSPCLCSTPSLSLLEFFHRQGGLQNKSRLINPSRFVQAAIVSIFLFRCESLWVYKLIVSFQSQDSQQPMPCPVHFRPQGRSKNSLVLN